MVGWEGVCANTDGVITGRPTGACVGIHARVHTQTCVSLPGMHAPYFPGAAVALQTGSRGDVAWGEGRGVRLLDQGTAAQGSQGSINGQWPLVRMRWRRVPSLSTRTGLSRRGSAEGLHGAADARPAFPEEEALDPRPSFLVPLADTNGNGRPAARCGQTGVMSTPRSGW